MHRIAIVSFKGGAGKSTTTANVAAQLVSQGRSVLAVDMDPQGGLTAALGADGGAMGSTWDLLGRTTIDHCIAETLCGVEIIPANVRLAGAELETRSGWQDRLRDRLDGTTGLDFVLIDSAPGLGVLPFMALRGASHCLIVCPPDFLSVRVIPHVLAIAERAGTSVLGIVPTMVTTRSRHAREALASMSADYADLVLPGIPQRVAVQDAALAGQPVQSFAPTSDATEAFRILTERIIDGLE